MNVIDELDRIVKELENPARVAKAGNMAAEIIRSRIYSGDGMPALSAVTQSYRGAGRPLQDTGALRDSIASENVSVDTVSVGTTKSYAPIQNDGGTITAKKQWLFIPGAGIRQLERKYGYGPTPVLNGLKRDGYSVYRVGCTVCYRKKGKGSGIRAGKIAYYLKKSVVIPQRRFFYLSELEIQAIMEEVGNGIF